MEAEEATVSADHVAELNRMALNRSAVFARLGGTALVGIGLVGAIAWLWITVHQQLRLDDAFGGTSSFGVVVDAQELSLTDRIDAALGVVGLAVTSALTAGFGLFLRVVADWGQIGAEASITGLEVGDPAPFVVVDIDGDGDEDEDPDEG